MPITIIVGGQFGSEGKGKVAHWFAREFDAAAVVRVGGPNSGHTVVDDHGRSRIFRQLPTAAVLPNVLCAIAAGSYIDPELFLAEVSDAGLAPDRVAVDPDAMVITDDDRRAEREQHLNRRIGSTGSGTGAAVVRRVLRGSDARFAGDQPELLPFVRPTKPLLGDLLADGARVLIEGTQGYGLSLLHSDSFPYVTSRDTTAAAFLAEAGLSPLLVDQVVLVVRAFPIRVAGRSGLLPNEIDWETLVSESGLSDGYCEYTSVTKQVRRIGRFDAEIVKAGILANQPTKVVLNHLDYVDPGVDGPGSLSNRAEEFIRQVEAQIGCRVDFCGTSPRDLWETQVSRLRKGLSDDGINLRRPAGFEEPKNSGRRVHSG